jgi:alkaline phosphatase
MGGGMDHFSLEGRSAFSPTDPRNMIKAFQSAGYHVVLNRKGLLSVDPAQMTKVLGLFSRRNMPYYVDRKDSEEIPALTDMVRVAIAILSQNPNGFFLMVEGGRIDHACHANDPVATVGDLVEFDSAVQMGLDFCEVDSSTLILVGADHETGGLSTGQSGALIHGEFIKNAQRSAEFMGKLADEAPDQGRAILFKYSGIQELTPEEEKLIGDAQARALAGQTSSNPYNISPFGSAFADILTRRAAVGWASFGHTGEPVIMTASGPGSSAFKGYYDNTDIAKKMAFLWDITLGSWPIQK